MDLNEIKPGIRVKTVDALGDTRGMTIAPKHLDIRMPNITGEVTGWVPGHGGDVWWVKHDDTGHVGAYVFNEFDPVGNELMASSMPRPDAVVGGGEQENG